MTDPSPSCPMPRSAVIDAYFMENRAKLIDIAAFLDRVGRSAGDGDEDFRLAVFRRAMTLLWDGQDQRARRVPWDGTQGFPARSELRPPPRGGAADRKRSGCVRNRGPEPAAEPKGTGGYQPDQWKDSYLI